METQQKKKVHHMWTIVRIIRVKYLLVVFICMLAVTAFTLRANNQGMIELRQAVYTADEQGGDVEGALRNLRQYVYSHMNTDLNTGNTSVYPPIQLEHTYTRLQAAQQEGIKQANQQIYTDAQAHCERLHPESHSGGPRVPCIQEYVTGKGVHVNPVPDSLYKFDFVSPRWTPDLAGWSVVVTVLVFVLLVTRIATPFVLKRLGVL